MVRQSWNPTWGTAAKLLLPFQLLYEFFIVISIEMMMNILGIIIYVYIYIYWYIITILCYFTNNYSFLSHFKYLLYLLFFFPLFFFTMLVIFWMGLHPALWPWPGPGEAAGHWARPGAEGATPWRVGGPLSLGGRIHVPRGFTWLKMAQVWMKYLLKWLIFSLIFHFYVSLPHGWHV